MVPALKILFELADPSISSTVVHVTSSGMKKKLSRGTCFQETALHSIVLGSCSLGGSDTEDVQTHLARLGFEERLGWKLLLQCTPTKLSQTWFTGGSNNSDTATRSWCSHNF